MSDIVIRNMKMPKSCRNCPLCIVEKTGLNFFCARQLGKRFSIELLDQRQEGCPLVELPQHGDLIDRSELPTTSITDYAFEGHTVVEYGDVQNAPTILEASEE